MGEQGVSECVLGEREGGGAGEVGRCTHGVAARKCTLQTYLE